MDLDGKKVVVLGGTKGIGLATAEAAADAGASVVIASRSKTSVDEALERLPADVQGHTADVNDEDSLRELFAQAGPFDHLVFTAGDGVELQILAELDLARARSLFDVRFFGALAAAKCSAPTIRAGGSMTFTTGVGGRRPFIPAGAAVGAPVYSAIESMVRALAVELAPIRVNAVAAGVVRTPLTTTAAPEQAEQFFAAHSQKLPVGRVGEPSDIAKAFLYLMSDGFCTGHTLVSDGGELLV